jgi:hypothetical protein
VTTPPDAPDVVTSAVRAARDARGHRAIWIAGSVTILAILALVAIGVAHSIRQQGEIDSLRDQNAGFSVTANALAGEGRQLADQVRSLGAKPVVEPPAGVVGPTGPAGPAGAAGRGITGTRIASGHLIVTYTDGTSADVGQVAGTPGTTGVPGATGAPGAAGRSITATTITGGHLIVTYSDGSSSDAGPVVGPAGTPGATGQAGRGVTAVTINAASHLIVAYSDGSSSDAGPLPAGPAGAAGPAGPTGPAGATGPQGAQGPPPASWTWSDVTGRHTCTRAGGTDAAPTYSCATQLLSTSTGR